MAEEQKMQATEQSVGQSASGAVPQTKFYKKWWFWLIIILLVAGGVAYYFNLF